MYQIQVQVPFNGLQKFPFLPLDFETFRLFNEHLFN
jgi:hypothetical protein